MKLKPHVAMYLIPVGILLLSLVFAGYMAVKAGQGFMERMR